MTTAFCTAMNQQLKKQKQGQRKDKLLHIMYAAILVIQIIFYSLRQLKEDGKVGILLRTVIVVSCVGLMIHGLQILFGMHVTAHGPRVIVFSFTPAAIVAFVLKN